MLLSCVEIKHFQITANNITGILGPTGVDMAHAGRISGGTMAVVAFYGQKNGLIITLF